MSDEIRITSMSAHASATNLMELIDVDLTNARHYRDNIQGYIRQTANAIAEHDQLERKCTEYYTDIEQIVKTFRQWFIENEQEDAFNEIAEEVNSKTSRYDIDKVLKLYNVKFEGTLKFYAIDTTEAQSVVDEVESDIERILTCVEGYDDGNVYVDDPQYD